VSYGSSPCLQGATLMESMSPQKFCDKGSNLVREGWHFESCEGRMNAFGTLRGLATYVRLGRYPSTCPNS
jgi:hypothetical protein